MSTSSASTGTARSPPGRRLQRKGATHYAIGAGLARILEAILRDERSVLPVSTLIDGLYGLSDVFLSLPCVVGARGVEQVLPLELSADEVERLRRSAEVLKSNIAQLQLSPAAVPPPA